jgi:hypothetical protein
MPRSPFGARCDIPVRARSRSRSRSLFIIPLVFELLFSGIFLAVHPVYAVFKNFPLIFPLFFHFARRVIDPVVDVLLLLFHRVLLRVPLAIELSVGFISGVFPILLGPIEGTRR